MTVRDQAMALYREMHAAQWAIFKEAMDKGDVAGMKKGNEFLQVETTLLNIGLNHCGVEYQLPQRAESRQQEFGYISEDDGQYHATRRIDWEYLLNEQAKYDYKCDVCQRHYKYSTEDLAWEHEHPFMLCGHPWKFLVDF